MRKAALATIILVVIIIPLGTSVLSESFVDNIGLKNRVVTPSYTPHPAITILSDADFVSQGWPGGGVSGNPYRISGLEITSGSIGIRIEDTTADFLIENCYITDGTGTGIRLVNVSDGVVEDVWIDSTSHGIYAYDLTNLKFTNITMISNSESIEISYSESITISHSHLEGIYGIGITLQSVTGSVVQYNNFIDKKIHVYDSLTTDISHNILTNDVIEVQNTVNVFLENNTILNPDDPGININSGSSVCLIGDNLIEDPTGYGISLDGVNTLGLINNTIRSGESTLFNLYNCSICVLEDNHADSSNEYGYYIDESTNILLFNNTANNCYDGCFYAFNSEFVNMTQNKVYRDYAPSTGLSGISVIECSSSTISQNNIRDHYFGITVGLSNFTDITENIIYENDDTGIYVGTALHTTLNKNEVFSNLDKGIEIHASDYCTLSENILYDNLQAQLFIMTSDHAYIDNNNASHGYIVGMDIQQCDNCTIINNVVHDIHGNGMYIHSMSDMMMSKNTVYDVWYSGLYLKYTHNSTITSMNTHSCDYYGVRIELSTNITLNSCESTNNVRDDVYLENSQDCTLIDSTLGTRGLYVSGQTPAEWMHTVISTTVKSGPVAYLYDEFLTVYDATTYGQLFIVNGSAIVVDKGDFSGHTSGVVVVYSHSITLNGVSADGCTDGFVVLNSNSVTLDHCRSFNNLDFGIEIDNSPSTSILSCTVYEQDRGIDVDESPDLIIDHCISYDNSVYAYFISESDFSTISSSSASNDFIAGIIISSSNNCTIYDNDIINSGAGVYLIDSAFGTIANNIIDLEGGSIGINIRDSTFCNVTLNEISNANYAAIYLEDSSNTFVDENEMVQSGLLITGLDMVYWNHTIGPLNTVNSKPVGTFILNSSIHIDAHDYGQLFLDRCSDIVIVGASFVNATSPLIIVQCDNVTASGFEVTGGRYGAMIIQSTFCTLENYTIQKPAWNGIYMQTAFNTTISDVIVNATIDGLYMMDCDDSVVIASTFSNCSRDAFNIINSDDCQFVSNLIYHSGKGFEIVYSFRNNFIDNVVIFNNIGFYIRSASESNLFLNNEIGFNSQQNAWDNVVGNSWDNGLDTGNAWSDYVSGGYYTVYGTAGAIDGFPTTFTLSTPLIQGPDVVVFWRTVSTHTLQWNVTSRYPSHYTIILNGSLYASGRWDGVTPFIVTLDTLSAGTYFFTLNVYAIGGSFDSDWVPVFVIEPTIPVIDEPDDVFYIVGETGNEIIWNPSDQYPASYQIYRNSILIEEGIWNGSQISINVDGLSIGTWTYLIVVFSSSMSSNDTVLVIVSEVTTTAPTTTVTTTSSSTSSKTDTTTSSNGPSPDILLVLIIGAIGGVAIVIFLVLVLKKKTSVAS